MPIRAFVASSAIARSLEAGLALGRELQAQSGAQPLLGILLYGSLEHDQDALLAGLREAVGPDTVIAGCSTQGIMTREATVEDGYFAGVMGFAGDVEVAVTRMDDIVNSPRSKGEAMQAVLRERLGEAPGLVILFYDPFSRADITELVTGLDQGLGCPVVGGAASQPWGPINGACVYANQESFQGGAVAMGLAGDFRVEIAASHGTEPIGAECEVTAAEGNWILELDGQPAAKAWTEATGHETQQAHTAMLALGIPRADDTPELGGYQVVTPVFIDKERSALSMAVAVPAGTRTMLHLRTTDSVLEGTRAMGEALQGQLKGRRVAAALGFECGARTEPFLGRVVTREQHEELQARLEDGVPWLGFMPWGEVLPLRTGAAIANYTFPVACLLDP